MLGDVVLTEDLVEENGIALTEEIVDDLEAEEEVMVVEGD